MLYHLPIHREGGMFRRFRPFACLVTACFLTLLVSASPAVASLGVVPNLEPLWKAYPLNPTGERLVKTNERPFVPPTTSVPEAVIPASDRDPGGIFRPALLCVLFAAVVAPILLYGPRKRPPKPNDDASGRLYAFSILGAMVALETLYGWAAYTLGAFLL
jgi:hypothetical protein